MKRKTKLFIAGIIIISLITLATALALIQKTVTNRGIIKKFGIEVYEDSTRLVVLNEINWGMLEPSQSVTYPIYIVNIGNTPMNLSYSTSNWLPLIAENYLSLAWSYTNQTLLPNEGLDIDLTLTVSSSIENITDFSFDTTISAIKP